MVQFKQMEPAQKLHASSLPRAVHKFLLYHISPCSSWRRDHTLYATRPNSSRCFPPACELDPSNHVLPTRRSETDHDVYSISPVGTAGFRSPEGSFLIVANDSAIIQPHLTPKADIWSFGVLLLRMFIWEDGPSSQREVC